MPALRLTWPKVPAWRAERRRLLPRARREERLGRRRPLHLLPAEALGLWCAGLAPLDGRQLAEAERLAAFLGGEPEIAWAS